MCKQKRFKFEHKSVICKHLTCTDAPNHHHPKIIIPFYLQPEIVLKKIILILSMTKNKGKGRRFNDGNKNNEKVV